MTTRFSRKTPRAVFVSLALAMTLASAGFIDFLATDYAVSRREVAQATPTPLQTAALHERR